MTGKAAELVLIDPVRPETAFVRCRDVVAAGGVIAFPTDTFYGLGADPGNPAAVKRLFEIKKRESDQPVLLLIADPGEVGQWAQEIPPRAADLMERFWPGPLTLVFKARTDVPAELTAGTGTIGLRIPGNELTRSLLRYLGHGLTGTSANISGRPSPVTAEEAAASLGAAVDLVLNGGRTAGEKPSTVVAVDTGLPRVLREGAIPSEEITG